jgi:hypothetical protein
MEMIREIIQHTTTTVLRDVVVLAVHAVLAARVVPVVVVEEINFLRIDI